MSDTATAELQDFIAEHGLYLEAESKGLATEDGWEHTAWSVTLKRPGESVTYELTIPWKQGLGIEGEPSPADVLDCLASDAQTIQYEERFEDWAASLGYDADSRKAEAIYNTVKDQTRRLRGFLGRAAFDQLLNCERL